MKTVARNHCVFTGKQDLQHLWTFKDFPVFMGCTDEAENADIKIDMQWWISASSGMIQLNPLVPLDVLYAASHGSGSVGNSWDKHHQAFAQFIGQFSPTGVIEFGGGHGALSRCYEFEGSAAWTIVEPNPSPGVGVKARYLKGFFDENFVFDDAFDAIVHSHVFEHFYEPDVFMSHLANFMAEGQHLIFSVPNMQAMMDRKFTNCINFEHTIFLTEPYIEYLLAKHGFRLISKQYYEEDHSIFYAAIRQLAVEQISFPLDIRAKNQAMYSDYLLTHQQLIARINQRVASAKQVYLFGGHVMSQYLIAFGLDVTRVLAVLDNDPKKHGRRLYGTSLLVQSPAILKNVKDPVVILRAGVFSSEIKRDILENINANTEFLE